MKSRILLSLSALCLCVASMSCALGDLDIAAEVPEGSHPPVRGQASVGSINDLRQFVNKPSDPSIPSSRHDVNTLSAGDKNRIVGRMRNTYGHAMGQIVLPGGETVQTKTRELVTEALARRGYGTGGGTTVGVDITKFWAWMTPGMWTVGLEARIEGRVRVGGRSFTISGYGEHNTPAAVTASWELAYSRAMEDFIAKLEKQLASSGL